MAFSPANCLYPAPVNELVFSDGRWRRFQLCQRAFLFHYVTCRGGYDPFQPAPIRQLYGLKQLQSFDRWINRILIDAVNRTACEQVFPTQWQKRLHHHAFLHLKRDCHHLRRESWRDDPAGMPRLLELHFGRIDAFALNSIAEEALLARLRHLVDGYGAALAMLPPGAYIYIPEALQVHYQGMTVYPAPALLWRERMRLRWVTVGIPEAPEDAWIRLYAWAHLCINPVWVDVEFADFIRGEAVEIDPGEFNFSAAAQLALERAHIMRDWLSDATGAPPETIPGNPDHCPVCRYREYCSTWE